MNAETDAFYGRDKPSRSYKWAIVAGSEHSAPRAVAWFKTRKAAIDHAERIRMFEYAIARIERLQGKKI